jgi:type I restriction enzyme R subunit
LAEGDQAGFEKHRQKVVEIATLLEEKTTIPAVRVQLEYLASMQELLFWEGMNLAGLENMRLRLRGLVQFLDKKKRKIVYTDFRDEVMSVRENELLAMPKMTSVQYEKKVNDYLRNHLRDNVVHRLRTNQRLTGRRSLSRREPTVREIEAYRCATTISAASDAATTTQPCGRSASTWYLRPVQKS